ncbi:MAG TPA: cell division protein FtsL [Atopobiaceae bacterium]|nr:cell division protein FtsL [Atopobiaceae bacterium]
MRSAAAQAIGREEMLESRPERELGAGPRFEVVEGGGLDVRVRAGVSSEFLARVKMVVMAAVVLFVLGTLRVALTSATVAQLSSNAQARNQIETFETTNNNLRVERSLLGSATRIDRIATQNYGMVAASSYDLIVIESEAASEEAAEGDAAPEGTGDGDAVGDKATLGGMEPLFEATQLAAGL